jgi:hypothetical protein
MTLARVNYELVYADIEKEGRMSDSGVLERTLFGDRLKLDKLIFPVMK